MHREPHPRVQHRDEADLPEDRPINCSAIQLTLPYLSEDARLRLKEAEPSDVSGANPFQCEERHGVGVGVHYQTGECEYVDVHDSDEDGGVTLTEGLDYHIGHAYCVGVRIHHTGTAQQEQLRVYLTQGHIH